MNTDGGLITLRLAMSVDGYIADEDGGYDWIEPVPSPSLDTSHQLPFDEFLTEVDVVVMGRRCYDQGLHRAYGPLGKRVLVATASPPVPEPADGQVEFVGPEVVELVRAERGRGRHCFLFGGGNLAESFLAADAVDRYVIGVVPVLLGRGRPLFPGTRPRLDLALVDYTIRDGKAQLIYRRR